MTCLSLLLCFTVGAAPVAALNQLEWMWKWPQMMKKVKCSKMKTKGLPLMTAITHPFIQQGTITCNDEVASLLYFSSNGLCACWYNFREINRACPRACPIIDNFREINFTKFFVNLMLMSFCCMKRLYIPFYFRECPRVCPIVVSLPCSALNCPALFSILSTSAENSMNFFSLLLLLLHLWTHHQIVKRQNCF